MSELADEVAAMTKPATAKPAMTPPDEPPAQTANTKIATCSVIFRLTLHMRCTMQIYWSRMQGTLEAEMPVRKAA